MHVIMHAIHVSGERSHRVDEEMGRMGGRKGGGQRLHAADLVDFFFSRAARIIENSGRKLKKAEFSSFR